MELDAFPFIQIATREQYPWVAVTIYMWTKYMEYCKRMVAGYLASVAKPSCLVMDQARTGETPYMSTLTMSLATVTPDRCSIEL